jgi:RNA polymerase sigma factor (sigma-70 family)
MAQTPARAEDDIVAKKQRGELLNASIRDNYGHLCTSTAAVLLNSHMGIKEGQLDELVSEVLNESIARALDRAERYDPSRRAVPWLMRFVINVFKERRRNERRQLRQTDQTDLGRLAWDEMVAGLSRNRQEPTGATKYLPQLDQALTMITPEQRQVLLLRFRDGMDGLELAQAVGAPSAGAARVRLHRALTALRQEFLRSADQEELES